MFSPPVLAAVAKVVDSDVKALNERSSVLSFVMLATQLGRTSIEL